MGWLEAIRASARSNSGYDVATYTDPATGRQYAETWAGGGTAGESGEYFRGTLEGYVGADGGAWFKGKRATIYDVNGNVTGSFEIADPNARDFGKMAALSLIAIATGGAALSAAGVIGGGATTAATTAGTIAGDAYLPGALGAAYTGPAMGSVLPGLEAYVLPATVAGTAAATATAASQAASATSTLTTAATGLASTVTKLAGTAASVLGLTRTGASAPAVSQPVSVMPGPASIAAADGIGTALFIGVLVLAGALALRKG